MNFLPKGERGIVATLPLVALAVLISLILAGRSTTLLKRTQPNISPTPSPQVEQPSEPTVEPMDMSHSPMPSNKPSVKPTSKPISQPPVSGGGDIYGGPIADAGVLGTCSQAIHDKYVVKGPDGAIYRTWHPQKDPSGCTFAHEHGENPAGSKANASLPPFGYLGKQVNDLEPHTGFKVSVVNEGDKNDEGSTARYSSRVVFHMGTGGVKRYTMAMHSLMFDLVGQGRNVHVAGMADTGGIGSICANPRQGRTVMQTDCNPPSKYEIWEAKLKTSKATVVVSMAQFDPITTRDPGDNSKVIYTPGDQHGCNRETYHGPVQFTDGSGGEIFGNGALMTYKGGNTGDPQTQFKIHRSQCAPGLGRSN